MTRPPEYVVFSRAALFEFLGAVALPPWWDGKSWRGGNVDCAPLAAELIEWVDTNDLSHLYPLGGRPVPCDECGQPIEIFGPDFSENGHICDACAVRISLGPIDGARG